MNDFVVTIGIAFALLAILLVILAIASAYNADNSPDGGEATYRTMSMKLLVWAFIAVVIAILCLTKTYTVVSFLFHY